MDEIENQRIMQFLIDNGADVNPRNIYGFTPLHCAVLHRNRCVIDILIQAGADVNAKSCLKRTALHFAISNYQSKQWKRTLPSNGTDPDMWMVEKLLDQQNIRVNAKDIRGDTPLMWAVMDKQVDAVAALLRKGANPNIRNKDSKTPLHVALSAEDPCLYIVVPLLLQGASLNCEDKEGNTPIDILIQNFRNTQSYKFAYTCLETIAFTHRIKKHQKRKLESIPELSTCLEVCCVEVMMMKLDDIANGLTVMHFMLLGVDDSDFENPVSQVYVPIVKRLLVGMYSNYFYYILERIPKSILRLILEITIFTKECGEMSDNDGCEYTSDNDGCEYTSDNDGCEYTSDNGGYEETPDNNVCEDNEETSDNGGCEEASDNGGCEEASDNGGCEEASDNGVCLQELDTEGIHKCKKRNPRDFFSKIDVFVLSRYLSRLDIFCLIVALSKVKIPECMRHIRSRKYY